MKKNFRIPSLLMSLLTLWLISAANLAPPPTPQAPSGATSDTTPTYQWTKVLNATSYQYQVVQGTTFIAVGQTSSFDVSVHPSSPSAVTSYILQTKGSY